MTRPAGRRPAGRRPAGRRPAGRRRDGRRPASRRPAGCLGGAGVVATDGAGQERVGRLRRGNAVTDEPRALLGPKEEAHVAARIAADKMGGKVTRRKGGYGGGYVG